MRIRYFTVGLENREKRESRGNGNTVIKFKISKRIETWSERCSIFVKTWKKIRLGVYLSSHYQPESSPALIFSLSGAYTRITDRVHEKRDSRAKCARSREVLLSKYRLVRASFLIRRPAYSMFHFRLSMKRARSGSGTRLWLSDGLGYVVVVVSALPLWRFCPSHDIGPRGPATFSRENRSILLAALEILSRKLHRQPNEGSRDNDIFMRPLSLSHALGERNARFLSKLAEIRSYKPSVWFYVVSFRFLYG